MKNAYSVHRPVANEYLVRERDRRRHRELGRVLLVLAPLGLALSGFTWIHLQVLDAGYEIEAAEERLHELHRQESRLRLEASYLASPNVVERRAVAELEMRPPEIDQLVFLDAEHEGRVEPALPPASVPSPAGRGGSGIDGEERDR